VHGYVTVQEVENELTWKAGRALDALENLMREGLAMVDDGHPDGKRRYWFPCVGSAATGTEAVESVLSSPN
jgi:ESCRT-II complex subunit VPS22